MIPIHLNNGIKDSNVVDSEKENSSTMISNNKSKSGVNMATFHGVNIRLLSRVLADDVANSFWNIHTSTEQVSADHKLYPSFIMFLLLSLLILPYFPSFTSVSFCLTYLSFTLPYPTLT